MNKENEMKQMYFPLATVTTCPGTRILTAIVLQYSLATTSSIKCNLKVNITFVNFNFGKTIENIYQRLFKIHRQLELIHG